VRELEQRTRQTAREVEQRTREELERVCVLRMQSEARLSEAEEAKKMLMTAHAQVRPKLNPKP
jgi:hypothetical protein